VGGDVLNFSRQALLAESESTGFRPEILERVFHLTHELSQNNPGLQATDLFSWGIFRKHERQDDEWYSFFSEWIIFEDEYLPRNTEDGP